MNFRYCSIFYCLFFYFNISHTAEIYELCIDQFKLDVVYTEYYVYCALKGQEPLPFNYSYVAVPWTTLIKYDKLHILPEVKFKNAFTTCQHISYESILPILRKMGISILFTPHISKGKQYKGIQVFPLPHCAMNGAEPAKKKDIYYAFVGAEFTHYTRKIIFSMCHPSETYIKKRDDWHFYVADNKHFADEYKDVLSRSRFSLCPRGTGANTIRFWESLQAGAIPVLVADAVWLPELVNWDKCIIRVLEEDVKKIPEILAAISPEKEYAMRKQCITAYKKFFSKENFASTIYYYMNKIKNNGKSYQKIAE